MTSQSAQVIPLEVMNRKLKMLKHLKGLGTAGALVWTFVALCLLVFGESPVSLWEIGALCCALVCFAGGPILASHSRERLELQSHEVIGEVALLDPRGYAIRLTLSSSYRRVIVFEYNEKTLKDLEAADDHDLRVVVTQRLDPLTDQFVGEKVRLQYP